MVLAERWGDASSWAQLDALIVHAGIEIIGQDAEFAEAARSGFLRYDKGRHDAALNLGDCASYVVAKHRNLPLLLKRDVFSRTDLRTAG